MSLLALIPARVWLALGLVVAVAGVYKAGEWRGYQAGKVEQLKASVEALKSRQGVDDATRNLDDRALCLRLGGVPDDCR